MHDIALDAIATFGLTGTSVPVASAAVGSSVGLECLSSDLVWLVPH